MKKVMIFPAMVSGLTERGICLMVRHRLTAGDGRARLNALPKRFDGKGDYAKCIG